MSSTPYHLMVTFWGERFREYFYSLCLRSLMSPNNLPVLRDCPGSKFVIATSEQDWSALQGRPLFEQMREYVEPFFIDIGFPPEGVQQILHMSKGHRLAARKAIEDRAWAGFVAPDLLVSDGMIPFVLDKARSGKKAVLAPALRFAMEPVMAKLAERGLLAPERPLDLPPRMMADMAHASLHSEIRRYEFDAPYFGDYPIWSYWQVPERNAIVVHTVSWALLLGDFAATQRYSDHFLEHGTIDGFYVYQNFYRGNRKKDLYLSRDSDELLFMSLTPEAELTYLPFQDRPINSAMGGEHNRLYDMHRFLFSQEVDPFRRWAYRVPCHIHGDDLTEASAATERLSAKKIERALRMAITQRVIQRRYLAELRRGWGDLKRYPTGLMDLGMQLANRRMQPDFLLRLVDTTQRRILRTTLGWMVAPVLGRFDRQRLVRTMKWVPKRYHRAVLRRVHSFQARAAKRGQAAGRDVPGGGARPNMKKRRFANN
jgi:hypothetical protein